MENISNNSENIRYKVFRVRNGKKLRLKWIKLVWIESYFVSL